MPPKKSPRAPLDGSARHWQAEDLLAGSPRFSPLRLAATNRQLWELQTLHENL